MKRVKKWGALAMFLALGSAWGEPLVAEKVYSWEKLPTTLEATAKVGEKFTVRLLENGTTGYLWDSTATTNCTVTLEHQGPAAAPKGFCGAPGRAVFSLVPTALGRAEVTLRYRRSWEKVAPIAKTTVVLTVVQ